MTKSMKKSNNNYSMFNIVWKLEQALKLLNFKLRKVNCYFRCWSYVGRQGGKQELCLDNGCHSRATVAHELGTFHSFSFKRGPKRFYSRVSQKDVH